MSNWLLSQKEVGGRKGHFYLVVMKVASLMTEAELKKGLQIDGKNILPVKEAYGLGAWFVAFYKGHFKKLSPVRLVNCFRSTGCFFYDDRSHSWLTSGTMVK